MITQSPYCNTLNKGDEVEDAISKRRGVVVSQPRETTVWVNVQLKEGAKTARPFHVNNLRFVVNGVPEDVPPFNGELPAHAKPKEPIILPQRDITLQAMLKQRRALQNKLSAVDEIIFELLEELAR